MKNCMNSSVKHIVSQLPQISRLNNNVTELQTLLRHKDDSSKNYRERTDAQVGEQAHTGGREQCKNLRPVLSLYLQSLTQPHVSVSDSRSGTAGAGEQ